MWQSSTFAIYITFKFSAMHCYNYSTQSCDLRLRAYVAWHVHLQVHGNIHLLSSLYYPALRPLLSKNRYLSLIILAHKVSLASNLPPKNSMQALAVIKLLSSCYQLMQCNAVESLHCNIGTTDTLAVDADNRPSTPRFERVRDRIWDQSISLAFGVVLSPYSMTQQCVGFCR